MVVVLSPHRKHVGLSHKSELLWNVSCFDRREQIPNNEYDQLKEMATRLLRPRFEGYQAREIHRQGSFDRDRFRYLPTTITSQTATEMTIRLSAGLLHEYLAGQINADRFRQMAFGKAKDTNYFELELEHGNSIRQVHFESGGVDEDDDYVIFHLDVDGEKVANTSESSQTDLKS